MLPVVTLLLCLGLLVALSLPYLQNHNALIIITDWLQLQGHSLLLVLGINRDEGSSSLWGGHDEVFSDNLRQPDRVFILSNFKTQHCPLAGSYVLHAMISSV